MKKITKSQAFLSEAQRSGPIGFSAGVTLAWSGCSFCAYLFFYYSACNLKPMQIKYVIKKSKRRSISLEIQGDCSILVKAPWFSTEKEIIEFIETKRSWILKHIEQTKRQNELAGNIGPFDEKRIRAIKRQARKIIPERVRLYAERAGITYGRIFIRLQKTCWGSCSAEGNLNFNCLLVLMPQEVMDSIIVHELCHRHHMNHSKEFYEEVYALFPEYKKWNKWIKENGQAYLSCVVR